MGKIILKDNSEIVEEDMFAFNALLKQHGSNVSSFESNYFGYNCKVDLVNQEISVNGVSLNKNNTVLDNIRWVNFKRTRIDVAMTDLGKQYTFSYGFGFQGNIGESNEKLVYIIKPDGSIEKD